MAVTIGSLLVSLGLDSAEFKSGLSQAEKSFKKAQRSFENLGKSMTAIGGRMTLAISAPLTALGVSAVKAAIESRDALGQVEAALKSMGDGAGRTTEQLKALAETGMRQSLYDDDEILRKVTANLLTFGQVAGDNFDRAQQAALDLSARLGQDLQTSTIAIGKALNEPVKGLAALRRVGIQFTEQQQEQIKAMAAVGDVAGAQAVMLKELERQFGGAAKAAREADPMAATRMSWAEFQETVGEKILPLLPRLTDALTKVLDAFGKLSPGMQTAVIIGGALAAAFGPVLVVLGGMVQLAAPLLATIKTIGLLAAAQTTLGATAGVAAAGFGSLAASLLTVAAPIAAVAAAGYLVYQNWDKIAPVLREFWDAAKQALGPALRELVSTVSQLFTELWSGPLGQLVKVAGGLLLEFGKIVGSVMGQRLIGMLNLALRTFTLMVNGIAAGVRTLNNVISTVAKPIKALESSFAWLYDRVIGNSWIPDLVDGIAAEMKRLDAVMVAPVEKATAKAEQAFRDMAAEIRGLLDRLFPETADALQYRAERELLSNIADPGAREKALRALALEQDEARRGSAPVLSWMQDVEPLTAGIDELDSTFTRLGANIASVSEKWGYFKQLGKDAFEEISHQVTGLLLGMQSLGDAIRSVVARLAEMSLDWAFKALGTAVGVPGFAQGTNFAPGGLALVGERGPELVNLPRGSQVIPNHEMRGMGGQTVHSPTFVFPGITNERQAREAGSQAALRYRQLLNGPVRA